MSSDEPVGQARPEANDGTAKATFRLFNNTDEMARLDRGVDEFGQAEQWPDQMSYHIKLALEEVVMNVINYAYDDDEAHEFEVRVESNREHVVIDVIDDGQPFDPLQETAAPDVEASLEARSIGGLGVFLAKQLADSSSYERVGGRNRITVRHLIGGKSDGE